MEQVTFDTNGIQYIFAYFVRAEANKEDGVDRWRIPPHRFQLGNTCSSATMGQFITTNWWSRTRPIGEKREFMIIGVKGHFRYSEILSLINGALGSRGHNRLTELEKMQGIVVKEHFVIPGGTTRALVETKKNIDTFNLTLKNDSKTIEITLSLRKLDNGLYVSLPSFSKVEQDQESAALSH
tara:strand:+ start:600 stop:1145 length:546 start_codon:yes stop_codon:yes gene_type:complete